MQQLQISRGKLEIRANHKELLPGELFIDYTHGVKYDTKNRTYELYAGCNGQAIKIGGEGVLTFIRELGEDEGLPSDPIKGGIYYVTHDIQLGEANNNAAGKDIPEFRKGDLAIYVGEDFHRDVKARPSDDLFLRAKGTLGDTAPGWIRINNGGGTAYEVIFDPTYTNFNPDTQNVQEALVELDRHKLAFGGVKFKKEVSTDDKDLLGYSVLATGDESKNILASELLASPSSIKAGYYYSVGELAANTNITIQIGATPDAEKDIVLEEGDFLAVISDRTTNDSALALSDLKFVKIAGGTHDSGRINYKPAGTRNDSYLNSNDRAWDDLDASVKNVKEALDDLFKSKADLTAKGKIPLTQLPDTLLQSMEFVGSFVLAEGDAFRLPTDADKNPNGHDDETTEGKKLQQGDYFIYTGSQINLNETDAAIKDNIRSSEGFLNSGDWLVYEGSGKWSVIDNTSPIQAIKVVDNWGADGEDDVIDQTSIKSVIGEIKIQGTFRGEGEDKVSETQLEADDKETITIHNKNSALIRDGDKADVNGFYKEKGDKTLVKTGVSETSDGQLVLDEAKGLELKGAVKATTAVTSKDSEGKDFGAVAEGDDLKSDLIQNPAQKDYGNIELKLPAQSGTLARLEDTGLTNGKDFFIPRYREDSKTGDISLVNSPIELIDHVGLTGDSPNLSGFTFHKSEGELGVKKDNSVIFRGSNANEDELVHIMPGTSGYILNSNSIIDCGEWTENGLVFEHEGDYNTYHNAEMTTTSDQYRNLIIANDKLDVNGKEIIDAYINGNA